MTNTILLLLKTNIISVFALCGSILGFFSWLDKYSSPTAKAEIVKWLKNSSSINLRLGNTFRPLFQLVYGERIFSLHGFFRSASITIFLCILLLILWTIANYAEIKEIPVINFTEEINSDSNLYIELKSFFTTVALYIIFFCVPCDYMTLLLSDVAIQKSANSKSMIFAVTIIFIAYFFCFVIYCTVFYLLNQFHPMSNEFSTYKDILWSALRFEMMLKFFPGSGPHEASGSFGPYLYSSIFALSWFILYICTSICLKIIMALTKTLGFVTWLLNVNDFPLTCIGVIAAVIAGLGYFLLLFFIN